MSLDWEEMKGTRHAYQAITRTYVWIRSMPDVDCIVQNDRRNSSCSLRYKTQASQGLQFLFLLFFKVGVVSKQD